MRKEIHVGRRKRRICGRESTIIKKDEWETVREENSVGKK